MKGKLLLFAAALAVASALVAVPLTTASSVDNKLAIGQSLHFLGGPGNSAGTFIASGAIRNSGTVTSNAIITPLQGIEPAGRADPEARRSSARLARSRRNSAASPDLSELRTRLRKGPSARLWHRRIRRPALPEPLPHRRRLSGRSQAVRTDEGEAG